ncbi:carbohydrate deacetylase isoform X3 [Chionomys nivalis]|uniref:carbohydrate deacetylase isoform X3 n=1 Tax=Chionomys nivalis TaxID=269649 RepID=UPI002597A660|nr:carbohydrate deacetylase isoform X3 [Chionomys nivalis]
MAWPRVQLVVTADDFGYCPRRDKGIVEAFLAGTVTSVSLLANGTAAESAAELARRHSIPTGLHANLTEGRPVGPARHTASSLLSSEGFFLGKMGFRKALEAGDVALPEVREELEAQLNRFRELLGRSPTHVDGHQHVHVLPGVRRGPAGVRGAFHAAASGTRRGQLLVAGSTSACLRLRCGERCPGRHGPLLPPRPAVDRCLCGPEHLWPAHVCSPSLGVTGAGPGRYPCWPPPDCRTDGTPRIPQCASSRGLR